MHVRHTIATLIASTGIAAAQEPREAPPPSQVETAQQLATRAQNPIANLFKVDVPFDIDFNAGPTDDAGRYELRFEPVIPIRLTRDWMVISRTSLPVTGQDNTNGMEDFSGLGDTTQSFFVTQPQERRGGLRPNGLSWGVGPAFLLPTATSDRLGAGKIGFGPTGALVEQQQRLTLGGVVRHMWGFIGDDERDDVNETYLEPFLAYTIARTTLAVNTETTYDWEGDEWTVPINASIRQLALVSGVPVQFSAGPRWYVAGPDGSADWGVRAGFTVLQP